MIFWLIKSQPLHHLQILRICEQPSENIKPFILLSLDVENRARVIQHSQAEHPMTLFITSGQNRPLTGLLLYFVRPTNVKELKIRNIHEVCCMFNGGIESINKGLLLNKPQV